MSNKSMTLVSSLPGMARTRSRAAGILLLTGDGVGSGHDAAALRIVGHRREFTVCDPVQQPLVFKSDVPDESQSGLGLRVRLVVEMGVGDRPRCLFK
jgi:hypothetical protein